MGGAAVMGELLETVPDAWAEPVGAISKLARGNREIPCWRREEEILMTALRER
jgi:hypothetical protein